MDKQQKRTMVFWHESGDVVAGYFSQQNLGCYGAISVSVEWSAAHEDYEGILRRLPNT